MLLLAQPRHVTPEKILAKLPVWRGALAWSRKLTAGSLAPGQSLTLSRRVLSWWDRLASLGERIDLAPAVNHLKFLALWPDWAGDRSPTAFRAGPTDGRETGQVPAFRTPGQEVKARRHDVPEPVPGEGRPAPGRERETWPWPFTRGTIRFFSAGGLTEAGAPTLGLLNNPPFPWAASLMFQLLEAPATPWRSRGSEPSDQAWLDQAQPLGRLPGWANIYRETNPFLSPGPTLPEAGADQSPLGSWAWWASRSQGFSLGIGPRLFLEKIFPDLNLAQVRIHTDAPAAAAAQLMGAEAFVVGQDIFFQAGRFNLATARGMALLGHELVHARQLGEDPPSRNLVRREMLELQAQRLEAQLLQAFPGVAVDRGEPEAAPVFSASQAYPPFTMELSPTGGIRTQADGIGLPSPGGASFSASAPAVTQAAAPLKAEPGRDLSSPAAGASPTGSTADTGVGSRELFRSLARKLVIDKERRGVDRWEL